MRGEGLERHTAFGQCLELAVSGEHHCKVLYEDCDIAFMRVVWFESAASRIPRGISSRNTDSKQLSSGVHSPCPVND